MDRQEYERLKEQEKAHLKKVRALKEQLRDAKRKERLAEALDALDTSTFDDDFETALRAVREKNVTSEARFDLAMEALESAEEREKQRAELARFEEEQRRSAASDLIEQMKAEIEQGEDAPERHSSQAAHGASSLDADPGVIPDGPGPPDKSIGRKRPGSD